MIQCAITKKLQQTAKSREWAEAASIQSSHMQIKLWQIWTNVTKQYNKT
jgi:hypothetical protein